MYAHMSSVHMQRGIENPTQWSTQVGTGELQADRAQQASAELC